METFNSVHFENMFFNVKSLWFFGLFLQCKKIAIRSFQFWSFLPSPFTYGFLWVPLDKISHFPVEKCFYHLEFLRLHIYVEKLRVVVAGSLPFWVIQTISPYFSTSIPFFNFHPHFIFIEVIWLSEIVASIMFTTCLLVFKVIRLNVFKSKFYQINEVARSIINWWDNWYAKEQDHQALVIGRSKNLKILRWWQA